MEKPRLPTGPFSLQKTKLFVLVLLTTLPAALLSALSGVLLLLAWLLVLAALLLATLATLLVLLATLVLLSALILISHEKCPQFVLSQRGNKHRSTAFLSLAPFFFWRQFFFI
jgi:hypothetical protein